MTKRDLPADITLNRFIESLNLSPRDGSLVILQEIGQHSIQRFDFRGHRAIELPLTGQSVRLEPDQESITLIMTDPDYAQLRLVPAERMPWVLFCENALNWIERELGRILLTTEQYSQELAEQLAAGRGFAVLQDLREMLGLDLFMINKQLEVLEWAGGEHLPSIPIPFISPKRMVSHPYSPAEPFVQGSWRDEQTVPLTWYPLRSQQEILGYLGLAASVESIGSVERFFLHKAATLLLLELAKAKSVQENERHYHRDFLFDLLYNNFDSLEVIISRGKLWGWDFSKPHFVIVGEIPGLEFDPSQQEIFEEVLAVIQSILRNHHPKAISLERNEQVVMLFPLEEMIPSTLWNDQAQSLLQPILKAMDEKRMERQLLFGVGNLYPTARYIHRSFQEARSALELGQLFNLEKRIIAFQDLGVMRLLYRIDRQELEDFRNEILGPLLAFDQENNLALEETLLAYLASSTDLNKAGERLFLHPNTLRYRLKKISEILGRDLSLLENQMNLFIALKIGKLKSVWSE